MCICVHTYRRPAEYTSGSRLLFCMCFRCKIISYYFILINSLWLCVLALRIKPRPLCLIGKYSISSVFNLFKLNFGEPIVLRNLSISFFHCFSVQFLMIFCIHVRSTIIMVERHSVENSRQPVTSHSQEQEVIKISIQLTSSYFILFRSTANGMRLPIFRMGLCSVNSQQDSSLYEFLHVYR